MTIVPTKFHWDILKNEANFDPSLTTIAAITITTRDTVPRSTVDPIPYIWFWQEDRE